MVKSREFLSKRYYCGILIMRNNYRILMDKRLRLVVNYRVLWSTIASCGQLSRLVVNYRVLWSIIASCG